MLKNNSLFESSEPTILKALHQKLGRDINNKQFLVLDFKKWVHDANDNQFSSLCQKYNMPFGSKSESIAAVNSLNNYFNGEDEEFEGNVNPKILFDYQLFILAQYNTTASDCSVGIYLIHEVDLTTAQTDAIRSLFGLGVKQITPNIKELI